MAAPSLGKNLRHYFARTFASPNQYTAPVCAPSAQILSRRSFSAQKAANPVIYEVALRFKSKEIKDKFINWLRDEHIADVVNSVGMRGGEIYEPVSPLGNIIPSGEKQNSGELLDAVVRYDVGDAEDGAVGKLIDYIRIHSPRTRAEAFKVFQEGDFECVERRVLRRGWEFECRT